MDAMDTSSWHCKQIEQYSEERPHYKVFADTVKKILEKACEIHAPDAIVQTRTKKVSSFAEKAIRKLNELDENDKQVNLDPLNELTDLCGGRVITQTQEQVDLICEFVRENFLVDEANSQDVRVRLKQTEFGYLSVHFIVQLTEPEVTGIPTQQEIEEIGHRRAEIQVRTLLQHAWADIMHNRLYKSGFEVPQRFTREASMLAATLEGTDNGFLRFCDGIDAYAGEYAAYMNRIKMESEIKTLRVILDNEPKDSNKPKIALRIASIAKIDGDYPAMIKVLKEYAGLEGVRGDRIRKEFGAALVRSNSGDTESEAFRDGQDLLEKVGRPDDEPDSGTSLVERKGYDLRASALAHLAWSCSLLSSKSARARTRDLYSRALALSPANPYHLTSLLEHEVDHSNNTKFVVAMRPILHESIRICRKHIEAGLELPRAYFTIGKLYLLMNRPDESLDYYTQAIRFCNSHDVGIPDTIFNAEMDFLDRTKPDQGMDEEYECTRRILLLGKIVWLHKMTSPNEAGETGGGRSKPQLKAFASELKKARKKLSEKASKDKIPAEPVLIIAGGARNMDKPVSEYHDYLEMALKEYSGTVISGGTKVGIPGLVGEISASLAKEKRKRFRTIGFLPSALPTGSPESGNYDQLRSSGGGELSPLEPIQYWIDIIASSCDPSEVRLLGINGGRIAAFEYRLALAMGAQVGVIVGSGREADKIVQDPGWRDVPGLLNLPLDTMTIIAFSSPIYDNWDPGVLETAGRTIHKNYVTSSKHKFPDPSLCPWEGLPEDIKESNRQQAVYAKRIFSAVGCKISKADSEVHIQEFEPEEDEVEVMAEIEHGRWVAERLAAGWKLGRERDRQNKISPYLVSWEDLPDEIRKNDREAVERLPAVLAAAGLEITEVKQKK